jgi:hypothetical protein
MRRFMGDSKCPCANFVEGFSTGKNRLANRQLAAGGKVYHLGPSVLDGYEVLGMQIPH